ncbi:MAG: hypothetical protein EOO90_16300 [Pedobacter sp.]|nr:MAG: hypothetical protein EOO90_16300 [Pedobacter sp.]
MKKVTFITTGQPSTNPRLVREVDTLINLGYQVNVVYCYYQNWALAFDQHYTRSSAAVYHLCGGSPKSNRITYLLSKVRFKLSNFLAKYVKKYNFAENAISRTHYNAVRVAKKTKADLYIAHNLGALPAAVQAAKHEGKKVGYDAEDMHSAQFEHLDDPNYVLNKYIETKYFPSVHYFTAASPLIAENYKKTYPYLHPHLLNNVFPKQILEKVETQKNAIKLFWFSQTIGKDRGIEAVITAMGLCPAHLELHLLGNYDDLNQNYFNSLAKKSGLATDQVIFHRPIAPWEIITFASKFDIGIASEIGKPLNRDICLTNKIFTYIQSGLAVIFSDTKAQSLFSEENPTVGIVFKKNDPLAIADAINHYVNHIDILNQTKLHNYELGKTTMNWESEREKFISIVNKTLGI